nr:hydroxylase [Actinoallomurus sp.]
MTEEHPPVLIVGGGPAGLSSALFLARSGIRSLLVERRPQTSTLTRATGVHARSMELFRQAGIEKDIRAAGLRLVPKEVFEQGKAPKGAIPRIILRAPSLARLDESQVIETGEQFSLDLTPAPPAWCGQDLLEPLMLRAARDAGADVRFGTALESFTADDDGVTAVIRDVATERETRVRADYLIAADGNRSPIREQLGIGRTGKGLLQRMISVVFHADLREVIGDRKFILTFIANEDIQGVAVCLDGANRWMFWTGYTPESGVIPADFDTERCAEMVRAAIGRPDHEIDIEGTFPWEAAHFISDSFRAGRVFLVGDAAHLHPPDGSFGANAGIQDGHNLAWKLAAVLHGTAGPGLLDSYDTERRPVGAATADQAYLREQNRATAYRHPGFRSFPIVIIGYRYYSSAVVPETPGAAGDALPEELDLSGRPGTRVPHIWLRRGDERVSTVDLPDGGFVLLTGGSADDWAAAAAEVSTGTGVPVRWAGIGGGDLDTEEPGVDWAGRLGIHPDGALLVRPDGFVAWRAEKAPDEPVEALREVLDQILSRGSATPGPAAAHNSSNTEA